jgi:phenylacetic acid degradation operon negative regulatory protein
VPESTVVSPFEIEEIFPGPASGSVSLPRRQSGSSPQGLAVALIADYSMRNDAWLPTAALVALLGDFGVTSGAARVAISRLARRGVLESRREGRYSFYRLTEVAAVALSAGGASIAEFGAGSDSWDGLWTFVTFSMPNQETTLRSALRVRLRWWGYAPLYDGVWVSPQPLAGDDRAELAAVAAGAITVVRAQHVHLDAAVDRRPVEAWDLRAIAGQYNDFIRRWRQLLPRIAAGAVTGAKAVRARTEVMDTYRRFPTMDPLLPVELLPSGWPRARAREVFLAVYDGLAEPAQQHVRAVVAAVDDGPHLDIRAHTVGEIHAGIRQTAGGRRRPRTPPSPR